jgi:hypothetical protein
VCHAFLISAALLGFLGGLLAVAFKGWVDYLLETRRERRPVRAAIRMLVDEASDAEAALSAILTAGVWGGPGVESNWPESRGLLAATLSRDEWPLAINVRLRVRTINGLIMSHARSEELSDDDRRRLAELRDELRHAGKSYSNSAAIQVRSRS